MKPLTTIKNILLDIIFPIECVGCKRSRFFLCDRCVATIPIHVIHLCPVCQKRNTPHGQTCFACLGTSALDGLLVATDYKNTTVSKAIHLYKYRFIHTLSAPLSQLLLQSIVQSEIPLPDLLCPIPLHRLRLRWRGFNQAKLIASELSTHLLPQISLPMTDGLVRDRFTLPQMSISDIHQRHDNIHNAFRWSPSPAETISLQGQYIWLIDDVATTTFTLNECARILKQNGAKKVFGVVLAR
jgi:competence protein ComFC